MSGVIKGVRKAFKKVVKVVKKVAPVALAAAAIYFTGGAALGATGGWGAAAGTAASSMGLSGTLGSVMTGAMTQAGYGAAIGGIASKIGGGSFSDGARTGAVTGAVTGGVMGGLGMQTDPLAGGGEQATQGASTAASEAGNVADAGRNATEYFVGPNTPDAASAASNVAGGAGSTVSSGAGAGAGSGGGGGLMSQVVGKGGWMERNQGLVGSAVRGIGQGLMSGADAEAEMDMVRERHNLVSSNYEGADPNRDYRQLAPGQSGESPTQRFDPKVYGNYEYQFNPKSGRIERVPVQRA